MTKVAIFHIYTILIFQSGIWAEGWWSKTFQMFYSDEISCGYSYIMKWIMLKFPHVLLQQ